jgi:hypothetical protein
MREKLIAFVVFILSILFLYKTWYFIPSTADMMPTDFIKVLFWAGYFGIAVSCTIIKPAQILITQSAENLIGMVKAVGIFFAGILTMPLIDMIYTSLESIWTTFSDFSDIFGFGYIVIGIALFIIIPQYMIIGQIITDKVQGRVP